MSILKDIIDLVKDFDANDIERVLNTKKRSSISKSATEGTLQFPVLITRSLDISTLNTVCSALEKQFASFAQIAMSMDNTANINEGGAGYLRRFHQNTGISYTSDDFASDLLSFTMTIANESGANMVLESVTAAGATFKVTVSNKEQLTSVLESLELSSLNSKFNPRNLTVLEKTNSKPQAGSNSRSANNSRIINNNNNFNHFDSSSHSNTRNVVQGDSYNVSSGSGNLNITRHDINERIDRRINQSSVMERKPFYAQNMVTDNDIKKSNELVPTTMHVRIVIVNDRQDPVDTVDFIIGIKAVMHPIKSEEMIENIYNACKKNGPFFDFVRWTTGEISFMKDLILKIGETKLDVYNKSSGASHWWLALKRRKNISKIRNKVFLPGGILPNTSIVMTMEEVDYIKTRYGYDLMQEKIALKIMQEYYLLSFVVVDMAGEIAHFLFDGQTSYQSTTFDGLRRETSSQNNINEVIKMANRLRI